MNTVQDWFNWRTGIKRISVEEQNANNEHVKEWVHKDVLYSFLGIYSIGLWVYYPETFYGKGKQ